MRLIIRLNDVIRLSHIMILPPQARGILSVLLSPLLFLSLVTQEQCKSGLIRPAQPFPDAPEASLYGPAPVI